MAYRYRSRRSIRKLAKKSRRNFLITLILTSLLMFVTIKWILPNFINGIGFVRSSLTPSPKVVTDITKNSSLAPPVLNIPYEATFSGQIDIRGYGTPDSKVAIFLDGEKKDIVETTEDGSFEVKNIQLALGTNEIWGKSIDDNDTASLPSKTLKIIYDNEKPPLNISEPEDGKKIQGSERKVKISASTEPNAQVFINNSLVIVNSDGNFVSEQTLNDGDNIFNIKAVDKALNFTEISRRVTYQP